jgi:hypothetical protein
MGRCPHHLLYIFSSSIFAFSFTFYTIVVFQLLLRISFA